MKKDLDITKPHYSEQIVTRTSCKYESDVESDAQKVNSVVLSFKSVEPLRKHF